MRTVWREYGVIAVLLVVAIGGYLYVSRHQEDLLALSLDAISGQLLTLVPESGNKARVHTALDELMQGIAEKRVDPEQVEQFAASVLNLGSAGDSLAPEEAELVVRLALDDAPPLPLPDGSSRPPPPRPAPPPGAPDYGALEARLGSILAFYRAVRTGIPTDSIPAIRFYADRGLHVVVDDRYRDQVASSGASEALVEEKAVSWRSRFGDAAAAERARLGAKAREFASWRFTGPDSAHLVRSMEHVVRMRRLESLGVIAHPGTDSLLESIEAELARAISSIRRADSVMVSSSAVPHAPVAVRVRGEG